MFGGQYSRAIDPKPGWAVQSLGKSKKKSPNFLGPNTLTESYLPGVGSRNVFLNRDQN